MLETRNLKLDSFLASNGANHANEYEHPPLRCLRRIKRRAGTNQRLTETVATSFGSGRCSCEAGRANRLGEPLIRARSA
jgi:hypothetical protein